MLTDYEFSKFCSLYEHQNFHIFVMAVGGLAVWTRTFRGVGTSVGIITERERGRAN